MPKMKSFLRQLDCFLILFQSCAVLIQSILNPLGPSFNATAPHPPPNSKQQIT